MMKNLLLILCFLPMFAFAQEEDNSKYMVGAVPEVNGKVVFSREINAPNLSKDQIFDAILKWANTRFKTDKGNWGMVAYSNKEEGQIACYGNEYLVFADKTFSLDRSKINYRMNFTCLPGKCNVEITNITYLYPEDSRERLAAEEWITDKQAMNKDQTKLINRIAKFRIKTVDLVENLNEAAQKSLGVQNIATVAAATAPTGQTTTPVQSVSTISAAPGDALQGYKRIAPDKIPGNIIKMLSEDWMLITGGNDEKFNPMTASWGGLGYLYNKPVTFCFINPARYTYDIMDKGDTYTLTFYTETYREALNYCGHNSGKDKDKVKEAGLTPITTPSGSKAFSEAWMIIECRKMVSQTINIDGISDPELRKQWAGKAMHKMFIGEILNVWVK
ncbi:MULTISPECIES: DUF4468 domain-containing protein [Odoribacteraceae]|uniref:DUF4468 domain-containing protein n=1 Tax=Odoribacteraceae TaxID=1853231 RepID=UPI000E4CBE54|nr:MULTISPECIES: DUF4468 domain-containing protein [Odoribacteraceae]MCQ4872750.1 DUF4468 domain-containing protein [Butyricimonas paravirosa]RHR82622.1 DUF4468 domain-containing protein [Odoribacter sp. AF15-53]